MICADCCRDKIKVGEPVTAETMRWAREIKKNDKGEIIERAKVLRQVSFTYNGFFVKRRVYFCDHCGQRKKTLELPENAPIIYIDDKEYMPLKHAISISESIGTRKEHLVIAQQVTDEFLEECYKKDFEKNDYKGFSKEIRRTKEELVEFTYERLIALTTSAKGRMNTKIEWLTLDSAEKYVCNHSFDVLCKSIIKQELKSVLGGE